MHKHLSELLETVVAYAMAIAQLDENHNFKSPSRSNDKIAFQLPNNKNH